MPCQRQELDSLASSASTVCRGRSVRVGSSRILSGSEAAVRGSPGRMAGSEVGIAAALGQERTSVGATSPSLIVASCRRGGGECARRDRIRLRRPSNWFTNSYRHDRVTRQPSHVNCPAHGTSFVSPKIRSALIDVGFRQLGGGNNLVPDSFTISGLLALVGQCLSRLTVRYDRWFGIACYWERSKIDSNRW